MTGGQGVTEVLELKSENRVACTDCKTPNLQEVHKTEDDTRIIRFIGVTDAVSNKHRFPHQVMEQMVNDAKKRYILPFMPASVKEVNKKALDLFVSTKEFGFEGEPVPMRDMHITDQQRTKVGRVLNVAVKAVPDRKNKTERKYMEVVAEVFDPHMVKLIDRGMATKFSIGFKHSYDLVDGIKVSKFAVLDHFGFVDTPADPESVLLEKKEETHMADTTLQDCIASKVTEGMSQEEAEKKCRESSTEAKEENSFGAGHEGEPEAGEERSFTDCVEGMVALGLDRTEAERACGEGQGPASEQQHIEPMADGPMAGKSRDRVLLAVARKQKELETNFKQLVEDKKVLQKVVGELAKKNKDLQADNKSKQVGAEIKLLMDEGKVTPATKEKVFRVAMAMDEKTRTLYYDTLQPAVDYEDKSSHSQDELVGGDKAIDAAANDLFGGSVGELVGGIKGKRKW